MVYEIGKFDSTVNVSVQNFPPACWQVLETAMWCGVEALSLDQGKVPTIAGITDSPAPRGQWATLDGNTAFYTTQNPISHNFMW